jgi:hypothetical protein
MTCNEDQHITVGNPRSFSRTFDQFGDLDSPCCSTIAWSGTEAGTVMYSVVYLTDMEVVANASERPSRS